MYLDHDLIGHHQLTLQQLEEEEVENYINYVHLLPQVDSLERILEDLQSYQIPQLGDCRGPKSLFDQLTNQVRSELSRVRRDLDELKLEVEDLIKIREREIGNWYIDQLQFELDQCTKLYRTAVVQAKRVIDSSQHYLNREELLTPATTTTNRTEKDSPSGEDALMSATSDVTEGLRRTLQLLQSEVDRSQVSNELLEQQTQTISSTSEQYSSLSNLLTNSKNLISSLEKADILDRLILFGAFSFFVGVCSYIFKKRVIDRGLKIATTVSGVLSKASTSGSGKSRTTTEQVFKQVVKEEFKEELEKVALATSAVVGVVKKAKNLVNEKLKERNNYHHHHHQDQKEDEEEESILDKVEQQIRTVTDSISTNLILSTTSISTSSPTRVNPSPTQSLEPTINQQEEEEELTSSTEESLESIFNNNNDSSDDDEEEEEPLPDSLPSPTSAIDLPEQPTPTTSTSTSLEKEENIYSPEPTLAPPIPSTESTPKPSVYHEESVIETSAEEAEEEQQQSEEATAEPESQILPPETPESTLSPIPSESITTGSFNNEPVIEDPNSIQDDEDDEAIIKPINPRQVRPPIPVHSVEEFEEEIFDSPPKPSSVVDNEDEFNSESSPLNETSNENEEKEDSSQQPQPSESEESESFPPPPSPPIPSIIDLDPLPSSSSSPNEEEDSSKSTLPPLKDVETIHDSEQITIPLDTSSLKEDEEKEGLKPETVIPKLHVEEIDGRSSEVVDQKVVVDLPIFDDTQENEQNKEEEEDEDEEKLLDDMFEKQMGDITGGGVGIGGFVGSINTTEEEVQGSEGIVGKFEVGGKGGEEIVTEEEPQPQLQEEEEESFTPGTSTQKLEEEPVPEALPLPLPEANPEIPKDSTPSIPVPEASPSPVSDPLEPPTLIPQTPLSTIVSQEASPTSSVVYESIPSSSSQSPSPSTTLIEPLEDATTFTPEDEVLNHEDTITEPSIPAFQIEQEEEQDDDSIETLIRLAVQSSEDDSFDPTPQTPGATETNQVEESIVKEENEKQSEISSPEANSVLDDVPTPSPAPTPEIPHISTSSTPKTVNAQEEEKKEEEIYQEEKESENPSPPREEPVPSPSSIASEATPSISQTPAPEPTTSSPVPSSTRVSEEAESIVATEEENVPNSDVVYPPADIDEPTTTGEAAVLEDSPIFEGLQSEEEEKGEKDDHLVVDDTQLPLHVEL
ncbi:hypothetical protein JCM3765_005184 [Sporobolomyces pararoseus]